MASFLTDNLSSANTDEEIARARQKDAKSESDNADRGTSERPGSMANTEKSAKIDALWLSLKRRSEQRLKERKTSTRSVNWNTSYDTPRHPKGRATQSSAADKKKDTATRSDVEIPGVLHVATVTASKPTSLTEATAIEQDEKKEQKRSRGGVDALLATFQKKKKPTVLDTSKQDWRAYKATHTTDAEELDAHHKSTEQYLEKQEFLTKTAHTEHQEEIRRKHKQRST